MAAVPPAAGAGAAALLTVLGLVAIVSLLVAMGVQAGYGYTFNLLLEALARGLDAVRLPRIFRSFAPLSPLARQIRRLNQNIIAAIGVWIAISERGAALFFHGAAVIVDWIAHEIASVAKAAFKLGENIIRAVLPRALRLFRKYFLRVVKAFVRVYTWPLRKLLAKVWSYVRRLPKLLKRMRTLIAALLHRYLPRLLRLMLRALAPVRRLLLRAIARLTRFVLGRLKRLAALIRALALRSLSLRKILRYLGRGLPWRPFLRLFLRALGKLDLGWLRARNVIAAGKWLMRQSWDVIDGLLAFVSVVEGQLSLDEFAHLMIEAEDEIVELTRHTWDVAA